MSSYTEALRDLKAALDRHERSRTVREAQGAGATAYRSTLQIVRTTQPAPAPSLSRRT